MELEVYVHVHHGQVGRVELAEDEGGLGGDRLEAEGLRALGCVRPEGVGGKEHGLARVAARIT